MINLLFLCTANSARSQIAEAFARQIAPENVNVFSAGMTPTKNVHELAVEVMAEINMDMAGYIPKSFDEFCFKDLDIVITLCEEAGRECSLLLPGHPTQVDWRLPDPSVGGGSRTEQLERFRSLRDTVRDLVYNLFNRGYLKALAWSNNKANLILDSLSEGIIAHDMNRRIIYFNGAAEAITGYSRREVLGRDCHDVFPGNFCGTKCSFCDKAPSFDSVTYPVNIVSKGGDSKLLEISVRSIKNEADNMLGVLASFRDLTHEHNMARRLGEIESFSGIIGRDKKMLEIFDLIGQVANSTVPVLVQGASGTGKELVAAAIHNESNRAQNLFVPVNCGALPEGLLESELFGHVKGAFTGAIRDKKGRFELADGGTIFLDEIGDISPAMQVKLLRVLQEGTFERVGDTKTINTNVRVISATNKDLQEEIAAGRFREDLYYRLCVVPINLPPLRERCGDIPLLVENITKRVAQEAGKGDMQVSPAAIDALLSYNWPGNIRELQNAIQFAMVKCQADIIEPSHLPPHILSSLDSPTKCAKQLRQQNIDTTPVVILPRRGKLQNEEVIAALGKTGGNKAKAARLLGVGRATLYRFLEKNPETIEPSE